MGWISDRHMRSGGSLNKHPERQRKGPLRKIVEELSPSLGMFSQPRVRLECGHEVYSDGQFKARCDKCRKEEEEKQKMTDAAQVVSLLDRLHARCSTAPCAEEFEIVSKAAVLLGFEDPVENPELWNALGSHSFESAAYRLLPADWDRVAIDRLVDGTISAYVYAGKNEQQGQAATLALALTEAALAMKLALIPEAA